MSREKNVAYSLLIMYNVQCNYHGTSSVDGQQRQGLQSIFVGCVYDYTNDQNLIVQSPTARVPPLPSKCKWYRCYGKGGYSTKFHMGRLCPEVQPLTFLYTVPFLTAEIPLSYTFYWQMIHLSHMYPVWTAVNTLSLNWRANHKTRMFSRLHPQP